MKELQSLCLDVKLIDEDGEEIKLKENSDEVKAQLVLNEEYANDEEEEDFDFDSFYDQSGSNDEDFDGFDLSFLEDKDEKEKNSSKNVDKDKLFIEEDIDQ